MAYYIWAYVCRCLQCFKSKGISTFQTNDVDDGLYSNVTKWQFTSYSSTITSSVIRKLIVNVFELIIFVYLFHLSAINEEVTGRAGMERLKGITTTKRKWLATSYDCREKDSAIQQCRPYLAPEGGM